MNTNKDNLEFGPGDLSIKNSDLSRSAFGDMSVAEFEPQTGWIFAYNINSRIVSQTLLNGGVVSHDGSFAKLETGTDPGGSAIIRTNRALTYAPGIGAVVRFTAVFDTPKENSQQIIGLINDSDGWAFGYNGLLFGILRRNNGVDEWIYQDDWNLDLKQNLIQQNGNVYQIKFQWLGFGKQDFFIENDNGDISPVHRIKYSNKNTNVSVENPSLPISAVVLNSGNTSNITLKTPSAVGGLEGEAFSPVFEALIAYEREMVIGPGETYMFGLMNPNQWFGKENRLYVNPKLWTGSTDGNKSVIFRVYSDPTLTGAVWNDVSSGISPLQADIDGAFVPNGEAQVFSLGIEKIGSKVVNLGDIDAEIQPNQTFAITAQSQSSNDVVVGITFKSRT